MSTWMWYAFAALCLMNMIVEIVFYRMRRRLSARDAERDRLFLEALDRQMGEYREIRQALRGITVTRFVDRNARPS